MRSGRERGEWGGVGRTAMLDLNQAYKLEELLNAATDEEANEGWVPRTHVVGNVKRLVKKSQALVMRSYDILMEKMACDDSRGRLLALEVCHVLMLRSKAFRDLVVENLSMFLELTNGAKRRGRGLPRPQDAAGRLRERSREVLREWAAKYGTYYKSLAHAQRYADSQSAGVASREEDHPAEGGATAANQRELHDQVLQILVDLPDFKEEYRGLARETEGLLDVLEESLAAAAAASSDEEEEEDDYDDDDDDGDYCEGLSLYATEGVGAGSSSAHDKGEACTAKRSSPAAGFLDAFRDLLGQLRRRVFPKVLEWRRTLEGDDPDYGNMAKSREILLRELETMAAELQEIHARSRGAWDLLCPGEPFPSLEGGGGDGTQVVAGEEDAVFEDAPPCSSVAAAAEEQPQRRGKTMADPTLKPARRKAPGRPRAAAPASAVLDARTKADLISRAPVVREPESVAVDDGCGMLANSRGLEIEGHWGPTDADAVVPSERAAIFNQKVSFWEPKEAAREYPICGARLRDGTLCQRRDAKVCPFHGKIVPRDGRGEPLEPQRRPSRGRAGAAGGRRNQRELDKEANLDILRELAGGKAYELPARKKGVKAKGKKGAEKPLLSRQRILAKLNTRKRNKMMRAVLANIAEIDRRNRSVNSW